MILLFLMLIYIVHDANIRHYFYIANDILKKVQKKFWTGFQMVSNEGRSKNKNYGFS